MSQCATINMLRRTCLFIYCLSVVTAKDSKKEDFLDVEIAQGIVRGHRDPTEELYAFYNVPYATAPTGVHKFKAPLPPPIWTDTFDAVDKKIVCPQWIVQGVMPDDLVIEEDCLVANIFVPDTKKKNLSVLVYVHGGAFQLGFGNWLKTKNFMKHKDVIVINFNYRLGIHGFLCLGTEDAPGNAGMKDQVTLLQWVQQNIAAFGGNPNDVTIAGYSAGSISVDLLMISKAAEGLFHKVIPESGANLCMFGMQSDPLDTAKRHAIKMNFTNVDDIYALETFYKEQPLELLKINPFVEMLDSTAMFVPCLEHKSEDKTFITESPRSILQKGDFNKVPVLYGFANMEGLLHVDYFNTTWRDKMNEKFSDFLPGDLIFKSDNEKEEVAKLVKEFYFGDKPIDNNGILRYVDFFSDIVFTHSTLWSLKLQAQAGHDQIYLYEYSFVDDNTPLVPFTNVRGATHCAQTIAVADGNNITHFSEDGISEEYKIMKETMRGIWRNFVKTGKPIPEGSSLPAWPAAGANGSPHMSLGQKIELHGVLSEKSFPFWENIYQKYYREPIPPPKLSKKLHNEL